jgi:hypothetical protein
MAVLKTFGAAAATAALLASPAVRAQQAFDACEVFTKADAESALGTPAEEQPFSTNPKVKRPKVVQACTYTGTNKDGKAVTATAQFQFRASDGEAQKAFEEARMSTQTKPFLISGGAEAFWSSKTGQMNLRKGRTWVTMQVGSEKLQERDFNDARKLAEILAKKI